MVVQKVAIWSGIIFMSGIISGTAAIGSHIDSSVSHLHNPLTVRVCGEAGELARRLAEGALSPDPLLYSVIQHTAAPSAQPASLSHAIPMHAQWTVWDHGQHGVHAQGLAGEATNQGATRSRRKLQTVAFSVPRQSRRPAVPCHAQ